MCTTKIRSISIYERRKVADWESLLRLEVDEQYEDRAWACRSQDDYRHEQTSIVEEDRPMHNYHPYLNHHSTIVERITFELTLMAKYTRTQSFEIRAIDMKTGLGEIRWNTE